MKPSCFSFLPAMLRKLFLIGRDGSLSIQPSIQSGRSGKTGAAVFSIFLRFRPRPWIVFRSLRPGPRTVPWVLLFLAWGAIAAGQWWVLEATECTGWILWGVAHHFLLVPGAPRRGFFWCNLAGSALVAWGQTQGLDWELRAMQFPAPVAGGLTLAVTALWTGLYLLPWLVLVLLRYRRAPAAVVAGVIGMDALRRQSMGHDWVGFSLWGWDTWVTASVAACFVVFSLLWLVRLLSRPPDISPRSSAPTCSSGETGGADTSVLSTGLSSTVDDDLRRWGSAWAVHIAVWFPVLLGWSLFWTALPSYPSSSPSSSSTVAAAGESVIAQSVPARPPCLLMVVETFAPVDHIPDWTPALRGRLRRRLESIQSMLDRHMAENGQPPPECLVVWPEWGREAVPTPVRGVTVSPFYTLQKGTVAARILWQQDGNKFGMRGKWLLTPIGERPCLGVLAPPGTPYAEGHYPPFFFWQGYRIQSLLCVEGLHPDFWTGPADILTISANWRLLSPHHRGQFGAILARRVVQTGKIVALAAHGHPALILTPEGPLSPLWVSEMIADDHQPLWVRFRVFELPPRT